jgi:hypothetical protein
MWRRVALVRTDVSKERVSSVFKVYNPSTGFLLGSFSTLKMKIIHSSETSVQIRAIRRYIPEDGNILVIVSSCCGQLYHFEYWPCQECQ